MVRSMIAACMVAGLLGGSAAAQTTSGQVTADETWSGTVTITGDIEVIGATVTVEPGTRVEFTKGQSASTVVNGTEEVICLILRAGAGFNAVGTEAQPILFTSAEASPAPGDWSEIDIAGAVNLDQTAFTHCVFEYGQNALDFRSGQTGDDWSTIELDNPIVIQYCTIRHMERSGIYITSGGEPDILNCTFHDLKSCAIFPHGAKTVDIKFCTIYDVSTGIISPGEDWWASPQKVYCFNNTIDNVRTSKADTPSSNGWTGYGIWCGNSRGTLYIRNTVISNTTEAAIKLNSWAMSKKNNCYYETGLEPIEGGTAIHSESIEADPLYTNAAAGDYSLQSGSPCIGAGYDSTNIGAWQLPTAAIGHGNADAALPAMALTVNPVATGERAGITVTGAEGVIGQVLTADGSLVQDFVVNDGRAGLAPVHEAGVYFIHAGGQVIRLLVK